MSNGKLLFEILGINVQINKWANKKNIKVFINVNFFNYHTLNLYKYNPLDTCKKKNILTNLIQIYYIACLENIFQMTRKSICVKNIRLYFKKKLVDWKSEIVELNSKGLYLKDIDHEISSPDIVDQAASQTEKNVEMRTLNRQIKLLSKIEKAIKKIKDNTYGYCEETGEAIGLKRLIARPIATLSIEAQEKHEKNEKIFADSKLNFWYFFSCI